MAAPPAAASRPSVSRPVVTGSAVAGDVTPPPAIDAASFCGEQVLPEDTRDIDQAEVATVLSPIYARRFFPHEGERPLGTILYGGEDVGLSVGEGCVCMTLPGSAPAVYEHWYRSLLDSPFPADPSEGDVPPAPRYCGLEEGIGWSSEGDALFAAFWLADQPALEEAVQAHYERLITLTRQKGYPHIYRMWNYLGAINQDNVRGEERYRDFCSGRAQAFEAMGIGLEDLPAATGIGLPSGGVAVFLIAQKDRPGINQENPCQLPAYHYPPRYGRRSPSFARATVMTGSARTILYLSGTASIRGHETIGTTLEEQITVTIETINTLLNAAKERFPTLQNGQFESLKLYVRHPEHAPAVKQAMAQAFPQAFLASPPQAPLLIADICRADLLLEVEGVFESRKIICRNKN